MGKNEIFWQIFAFDKRNSDLTGYIGGATVWERKKESAKLMEYIGKKNQRLEF